MKTIIAEKPSVAREIARIVGATEREEGYFTGNGGICEQIQIVCKENTSEI